MRSLQQFRRPCIDLYVSEDAVDAIRTVPQLINWNAENNPDLLFCYQAVRPTDGSTTNEPVRITFANLKDAVAQCANRLVSSIKELQLPTHNADELHRKRPPIALLVESDVSLLFHLFALMGLGVPVLLLSARLSSAAVRNLLLSTRTAAVITTPRLSNTVYDAVDQLRLSAESRLAISVYLQQPFGDDLIDTQGIGGPCYPRASHYMDDADRDVVILHSSGTTSLPKPIYQSHKYMLSYANCHSRTDHEDVRGLNMSSLPLYHGFGLVCPCLSLGIGKPCWLQPGNVVSTGTSIVEAIKLSGARSLMTVPMILEEIIQLPADQGIQALLPLQFVASAGGPLKDSVGETLAEAGVKLLGHFGTTEIGPIAPIFAPSGDYDWHYFRLRQDIKLDLEPIGPPERGIRKFRLTAHPFAWDAPFVLQDNLESSPANPTTDFRATGRNDDLIVLATGEKVIPRILESMLSESPLVKAAIVFGDGQFEIGVIVEPAAEAENVEDFKEAIWPVVMKAGNQMDSHARISCKTSIALAPSGTAIPRSDKGSILRKEAYQLFDPIVQQVYKDLGRASVNDLSPVFTIEHLESDITQMIVNQLDWIPGSKNLCSNDDLFDQGLDSLGALRLRRLLVNGMKRSPELATALPLSTDFVYRNSTVTKMARYLRRHAGVQINDTNEVESVDGFVARYSTFALDESTDGIHDSGSVVLLTGSKGNLGSHVLAYLVGLSSVSSVICLDRTRSSGPQYNAHDTMMESLSHKGIQLAEQDESKVVVMSFVPSAPRLGLSEKHYSTLRSQVTHIIHGAWPMDFKRELSSFESQFHFLRNLLVLARGIHASKPSVRPRVMFISSIAVVGQYACTEGQRIVPEVQMLNENWVNKFGYGKAKLVCERMMEGAAQNHHGEMEIATIRVGQLSGSSRTGFWNPTEHFPQLVRLSQQIAMLPKLDGTLSWIPVDHAAQVLSEIAVSLQPLEPVYHIENPVRQSWHDVLNVIASELGLQNSRFVTFSEWLDRITSPSPNGHAQDTEDSLTMLINFFREDFLHMSGGNVILGTDNTRKHSQALSAMDAVPDTSIKCYISRWRESGLLN